MSTCIGMISQLRQKEKMCTHSTLHRYTGGTHHVLPFVDVIVVLGQIHQELLRPQYVSEGEGGDPEAVKDHRDGPREKAVKEGAPGVCIA